MKQAQVVVRAAILQNGLLIAQRNFKLTLCRIMRDGVTIHETFCVLALPGKFYAKPNDPQHFLGCKVKA